MGIENKTEFNKGHIVEALDRCMTIMSMVDNMLYMHPAIIKAGCNDEVDRIGEQLAEIYQKVGEL